MYALVLFTDESYYVCKSKDIIEKDNKYTIRYKGSRYAGNIVAYNDNSGKLIMLKKKLEIERREVERDSTCYGNKDLLVNLESTEDRNNNIENQHTEKDDCPILASRDVRKSVFLGRKKKKKAETASNASRLHRSEGTVNKVSPSSSPCDRNASPEHISAVNDNPDSSKKVMISGDKVEIEPCEKEHSSTDNGNGLAVPVNVESTEDENNNTENQDTRKDDIATRATKDVTKSDFQGWKKDEKAEIASNISRLHGSEETAIEILPRCFASDHDASSEHVSAVNHNRADISDNQLVWKDVFLPVVDKTSLDIQNSSLVYSESGCVMGLSEDKENLDENSTISFLSSLPIVGSYAFSSQIDADLDTERSALRPTKISEANVLPSTSTRASLNDIASFPAICGDENWLNVVDPDTAQLARTSEDHVNSESCSSDGSAYAPEEDSSNDSEDSKYEEANRHTTVKDKSNQSLSRSVNVSTDLDASVVTNRVGHSAPDDEDMFVKTVEGGTKRDFCIYCKTEQTKLCRHVVRQHQEEEEVAKFLSFDKGSDERKMIMAAIRKKGMFYFNTDKSINTGERRVIRRPNVRYNKKATDFATCPTCLGDYARNSLRHHSRRCGKRSHTNKRTLLLRSKRLVGRIHPIACKILRLSVFPTFQEDAVVKAIRYDELLILFGNKLCQKYQDPYNYDMIRQKLRHLGRFLLEVRKHNCDIHDLFSVFFPKNYDSVITAVQSLAGINELVTGFKKPSLATTVGTLVKQVGKLCVSEWIKKQNKNKQTYAEDFLKLLIEDFTTTIARTALETQCRNKRQKKIVLPSREDIQKLNLYLRDKVRMNYGVLKTQFSLRAWFDLGAAVLLSIELFNRRRPGEMERMFIDDFLSFKKIDERSVGEAYNKLSGDEKQAALKYVRFEIRGKLRRDVGVLLDVELLTCIQLLLAQRREAKVNPANPYVFGIPGSLKGNYRYHRACELLRQFAQDCGAEKPETLRWTNLRKHVATMCVNYDLTEGQVSDLANFMGHADRIHKEHYRLPILTREIIHISKLLETVQGKHIDSEISDISDDEGNTDRFSTEKTFIDPPATSPNPQQIENGPEQHGTISSDRGHFEKLESKNQKKKRSSNQSGA